MVLHVEAFVFVIRLLKIISYRCIPITGQLLVIYNAVCTWCNAIVLFWTCTMTVPCTKAMFVMIKSVCKCLEGLRQNN